MLATCAACFGAPSSSCLTVRWEMPPSSSEISQVRRVKPSATRSGSQAARHVCELPRRVGLDHLALDEQLGHAHRLCLCACPRGRRRPGGGRTRPPRVAVPLVPLGLRDRVPDRLRGRLDVDAVDLRVTPSRSWCSCRVLQFCLEVCERRHLTLGVLVDPPVVDQPDRHRVEEVQLLPARPARDHESCVFEDAEVFITPKRVISSSDSSSVSVRPSRSKSRSSRRRRVGSASALNTRSSSVTR